MKVKMYHILGLSMKLQAIADKPMPAKTAYKIARLLSSIEEPMKILQSKSMEAIERYSEYQEDGKTPIMIEMANGEKTRSFTEENKIKLQKEMNDLENIEEELPDCSFTFDEIDAMGDIDPLTIKALMPFIKDKE